MSIGFRQPTLKEHEGPSPFPPLFDSGLNFTFLPPWMESHARLVLMSFVPPFSLQRQLLFAFCERMIFGVLVIETRLGSHICSSFSPPVPKGSKGPWLSVFPLPHHESLPINAPGAGGAGPVLGEIWTGLCALLLPRQQQTSPPRLEII